MYEEPDGSDPRHENIIYFQIEIKTPPTPTLIRLEYRVIPAGLAQT